jgi:hypothetical protein
MAANLVYISLSLVTPSWDTFQSCKIRALNLHRIPHLPTFSKFRDILASLDQLELLSLVHSIPPASEDPTVEMETLLRLPNLLWLYIVDDYDELCQFHRMVTIEPHTKVSIVDVGGYPDYTHPRWIDHAVTRLRMLPGQPWLTLSVDRSQFNYSRMLYVEGPVGGPAMLSIDIELFEPKDGVFVASTVLHVLTDHVRKIKLAGHVVDEEWSLSTPLPHVHTVEAIGPAAVKVINSLKPSSVSSEQMVWPNLSSLDISYGQYTRDELHALEAALRGREQIIGRRIATLYVCSEDVGKVASNVADLIMCYPNDRKLKGNQFELSFDVRTKAFLEGIVEREQFFHYKNQALI